MTTQSRPVTLAGGVTATPATTRYHSILEVGAPVLSSGHSDWAATKPSLVRPWRGISNFRVG